VRHVVPRRGGADRSARATAVAARARSARRSGAPRNAARYPGVWFRLLEARAWHGKLNAKGPGVAGALQSNGAGRWPFRAPARGSVSPALLDLRLFVRDVLAD